MTREFIYTQPFCKLWATMGLNDEDLKELENVLLENPQAGTVIQGTGGARKMPYSAVRTRQKQRCKNNIS